MGLISQQLFNGPSEETKAKAVKSAETSRRLVFFTPGGFLHAARGGGEATKQL